MGINCLNEEGPVVVVETNLDAFLLQSSFHQIHLFQKNGELHDSTDSGRKEQCQDAEEDFRMGKGRMNHRLIIC